MAPTLYSNEEERTKLSKKRATTTFDIQLDIQLCISYINCVNMTTKQNIKFVNFSNVKMKCVKCTILIVFKYILSCLLSYCFTFIKYIISLLNFNFV